MLYYLRHKKRSTVFEIVKIVKVFKKIRTIAILMRKDVRNSEKIGLVTLRLAIFEQYRLLHRFWG